MTRVHSCAYMTALDGRGDMCILATETGRGAEDWLEERPSFFHVFIIDQAPIAIRRRGRNERCQSRPCSSVARDIGDYSRRPKPEHPFRAAQSISQSSLLPPKSHALLKVQYRLVSLVLKGLWRADASHQSKFSRLPNFRHRVVFASHPRSQTLPGCHTRTRSGKLRHPARWQSRIPPALRLAPV
jgi:hypothetical protein